MSIVRCPWAEGSDDYRAYHDEEWGVPVHGDTALFERVSLEAFQSGLSWLTILRKRPSFREAFAGFDSATVAQFGPADVERLMLDAGIVRNRRKVEATISNARAVVALQQADGPGALDRLLWAYAPSALRVRPRSLSQVPATSAESVALSKELKARGFVFVGPTTLYAAMQACGLVDDHVADCHRAVS